ncbi:helix-turn-helix domain-containing protein [Leptospira sanjuanensis]|uniref:helix-turn-helix domain-containing protein n=1 Tax=Leptospira sanjuanensis TaxID=2879643 RepID=UPI001EE900B5|nr:helix-turn-helix domain-containing protein [Leptospira sanjuanensis]MCG6170260.1 helix-turn-helix domain-containing protein [Leptospira sanjuanensis]
MQIEKRVFRVIKDRDYSVVKNDFIDDDRMSHKATSILMSVLRYPDHYRHSIKSVARLKRDSVSSVASGFKELVEYGYAEFKKEWNPETRRLENNWYFFEVSKIANEPKEKNSYTRNKKTKPQPKTEGLSSADEYNDFFLCSENRSTETQSAENSLHSNTLNQVLNTQVRSFQELKNPREYKGAGAQADSENQQAENRKPFEPVRYNFPNGWLIDFQDHYFKEHQSEMGQPVSELKALNTLFEFSKGNWTEVELKIKTLKKLRKEDPKFWAEQPVSPESVAKFWSRLFERPERTDEIKTKRKENFERRKPMKENTQGQKPKEEKGKSEYQGRNAYECFLEWGRGTKLLFGSQLEFYIRNQDSTQYEGTKKILFEKFVNEIYPTLTQRLVLVEKTKSENEEEFNQKRIA